MAGLKLCSGAEAVRKFQKAGWVFDRQKGSHVMLSKPDYKWTLSVLQHRELGIGILKKLVNRARLRLTSLMLCEWLQGSYGRGGVTAYHLALVLFFWRSLRAYGGRFLPDHEKRKQNPA